MTEIAISHNGVPVRLTEERWCHIIERHETLASQKELVLEVIANPDRILEGNEGALLAVRTLELDKWLVVVYRENDNDGFIITAFATRRINSLNRRKSIWP